MTSKVLIVSSNMAHDTNGQLIPEMIEIVPEEVSDCGVITDGSIPSNVTTYSIVYADSPSQIITRNRKRKQSKTTKNILVKNCSSAQQTESEKSKKKAGILCSFSECSCSDRKCNVFRTVKKPVITAWRKFIQDNDNNPRVHKEVRLCKCHFRNLNKDTPKDDKLEIFMNPEIVTSSTSSYHINYQHRMLQATEKLNLIEESLSKMFNEDQVKKLMDDKPFVHYSDKTIEESCELYKACGVKGYQMLLKRGYPLPTIRTIQRMRRKKCNEDSLNIPQGQVFTIEAIIDDE